MHVAWRSGTQNPNWGPAGGQAPASSPPPAHLLAGTLHQSHSAVSIPLQVHRLHPLLPDSSLPREGLGVPWESDELCCREAAGSANFQEDVSEWKDERQGTAENADRQSKQIWFLFSVGKGCSADRKATGHSDPAAASCVVVSVWWPQGSVAGCRGAQICTFGCQQQVREPHV